ncbi:MAG: acyl-ACP--UDP-N-acetylglucosamine O-acyltransferase [Pseudomonadota bacterium]
MSSAQSLETKFPTTEIHPSAIVEDGSTLGAGVQIGPFCHIGPQVVLGDGVELMSHVVISGRTELGDGCRVYPHAVLGGDPQHVGYRGEDTGLLVGKNTVIREGVTMNRGMPDARVNTCVGDNCMFLAYSHVAHDCLVGDNVVFANNVMIGGHCTIGDGVIMGGGSGLHQFCRVGHHAFIGGMAGVEFDVIPYGMALGGRAHLGGLNIIGMKRSGMPRSEIHALRHGVKKLFTTGSGKTLRDNASQFVANADASAAMKDIAQFILSDSKRKFITPRDRGVLTVGTESDDEA